MTIPIPLLAVGSPMTNITIELSSIASGNDDNTHTDTAAASDGIGRCCNLEARETAAAAEGTAGR